MYRRNIEERLRAGLQDTPVVFLSGARQTGKSTLAQQLARARSMPYVTLDEATAYAAAAADPQGYLKGLGPVAAIDEVQRVPGLFRALKAAVDTDRKPGRFLLTGSANVMLLPGLSDALAGRMEIVPLRPLSQGELRGIREGFIDRLLAPEPVMPLRGKGDLDVGAVLAAGGYPEALERADPKRRASWFDAYVATVLQRDIRDLANIDGLSELPRLLALLAARSASLVNASELSRASGLPLTSLRRYLALLEAACLFEPLPAWSANLGKRLTKSPKAHLGDPGLAAHLTGHDSGAAEAFAGLRGRLFETFVVCELRKQASWSETAVRLFHFRTHAGREVDVVMEDRRGRIAGVEVKAATSVSKKDFAGLEALAQETGKRFVRGCVLYTGEGAVAFGERLCALPLSALWRLR
jgi:hypothetical protein